MVIEATDGKTIHNWRAMQCKWQCSVDLASNAVRQRLMTLYHVTPGRDERELREKFGRKSREEITARNGNSEYHTRNAINRSAMFVCV